MWPARIVFVLGDAKIPVEKLPGTKIKILKRDFDKKDKLIALSIDDLFDYLETKIRKKP